MDIGEGRGVISKILPVNVCELVGLRVRCQAFFGCVGGFENVMHEGGHVISVLYMIGRIDGLKMNMMACETVMRMSNEQINCQYTIFSTVFVSHFL